AFLSATDEGDLAVPSGHTHYHWPLSILEKPSLPRRERAYLLRSFVGAGITVRTSHHRPPYSRPGSVDPARRKTTRTDLRRGVGTLQGTSTSMALAKLGCAPCSQAGSP